MKSYWSGSGVDCIPYRWWKGIVQFAAQFSSKILIMILPLSQLKECHDFQKFEERRVSPLFPQTIVIVTMTGTEFWLNLNSN